MMADNSTEPWTAQLAAATLSALGGTDVLELGPWSGRTGAFLCFALQRMGGGTYITYDSDVRAVTNATTLLDAFKLDGVDISVRHGISPACLASLPDDSIDFVWLDDLHVPSHVIGEIDALRRIVRPKGIICGHDTYGKWELRKVFEAAGGYALDLPVIVPGANSGGIGFLQV